MDRDTGLRWASGATAGLTAVGLAGALAVALAVGHLRGRRQRRPGHLGRLVRPLVETRPVGPDCAQWSVWGTTARVVVTDPAARDAAEAIVRAAVRRGPRALHQLDGE